MSPEELEAFYAGEYRLLRQGTPEPVKKDLQAQAARAVVTVRLTNDWLSAVSRHLDVGSSSGALLEAFHERFACTSIGIEPSESYRRFSQARGLRVYPTRESLIESGEGPFDVVTAMHVLEHTSDPVDTLAVFRTEHMRPGALLLVETPNLADHQAFELAHLHAFTAASLADAARRAGFEILWTRVHGGYRSPVLRLFVTVLARASGVQRSRRYLPFASWRSRLGRRIGVAKRDFFTRHYPDWTWQSPEKVLET
jgi:hypothetical protein